MTMFNFVTVTRADDMVPGFRIALFSGRILGGGWREANRLLCSKLFGVFGLCNAPFLGLLHRDLLLPYRMYSPVEVFNRISERCRFKTKKDCGLSVSRQPGRPDRLGLRR